MRLLSSENVLWNVFVNVLNFWPEKTIKNTGLIEQSNQWENFVIVTPCLLCSLSPRITLLNLADVRSWTRSDVHTRLVCHMLFTSWQVVGDNNFNTPHHLPRIRLRCMHKANTWDSFGGGKSISFKKRTQLHFLTPFVTNLCTPAWIYDQENWTCWEMTADIFSVSQGQTNQCALSCSTSPFMQPTPILSPALPTHEMACGARKKATTDWPSEMSNRFFLKVILYLSTLCSKELSLEKTKLPRSSSPFGAPVSTLQTLIVPSSLLETNVFSSTYSSLVTLLLKNSSELVPVPNPKMSYIKHEARVSVLSLLTLEKKTNALKTR